VRLTHEFRADVFPQQSASNCKIGFVDLYPHLTDRGRKRRPQLLIDNNRGDSGGFQLRYRKLGVD